jgi:hypothetical protein
VATLRQAALVYALLIHGLPLNWVGNDPDLQHRRKEYATAGAKLLARAIDFKRGAPLEERIALRREISRDSYEPLRDCEVYRTKVAPWCRSVKREADARDAERAKPRPAVKPRPSAEKGRAR